MKKIFTNKKLIIVVAVTAVSLIGVGVALSSNTFTKEGDITKVEKTKFMTSFESLGGTAIGFREIKKGDKIEKPKDPVRSGFIFEGWELDGELFDFDTPVTKDIKLIARWRLENPDVELLKLTFDSNGGTRVQEFEVIKGKAVTKPLNPTRNGFTFKGWHLDGKLFDFNTPITEDTTLKAEWERVLNPNYNSSNNANDQNQSNNTPPANNNQNNSGEIGNIHRSLGSVSVDHITYKFLNNVEIRLSNLNWGNHKDSRVEIQRSTNQTAGFTTIGSVSINSNSNVFASTNLSNNVRFFYRARVVNVDGAGNWSNIVEVPAMNITTKPTELLFTNNNVVGDVHIRYRSLDMNASKYILLSSERENGSFDRLMIEEPSGWMFISGGTNRGMFYKIVPAIISNNYTLYGPESDTVFIPSSIMPRVWLASFIGEHPRAGEGTLTISPMNDLADANGFEVRSNMGINCGGSDNVPYSRDFGELSIGTHKLEWKNYMYDVSAVRIRAFKRGPGYFFRGPAGCFSLKSA